MKASRPCHRGLAAWSIALCLAATLLAPACSAGSGTSPAPAGAAQPAQQHALPAFDADTALVLAARQMEFGPRVPGTAAHEACRAWMTERLRAYGAEVREQQATVTAYDGTRLEATNVMASYRPEARERVLLVAHWDSRHMADEDPRPERRQEGVPAANDGASGVAVLMELARTAGRCMADSTMPAPRMGIDILLVDAEDYGAPDTWMGRHREEDWALGTQAWARQARAEGYVASYGILLDMVGAPDATFYREYYSDRFAPQVVDMVWSTAQQMGYGTLFVNEEGPAITDDHVFVSRLARIPTIDIIDTRQHEGRAFYPYWHTTDDTIDKLSAETLGRVGRVLVALLW